MAGKDAAEGVETLEEAAEGMVGLVAEVEAVEGVDCLEEVKIEARTWVIIQQKSGTA
jgi:hypothetical protein